MARVTSTASGSIASFKSPGIVPIRSLKAHFLPVQEGTGDPSPSNIRPITGWTGMDINKYGSKIVKQDNPNEPTANYYCSSTGTIEWSEEESAFIHTGSGVGYSAHAYRNGSSSKYFIAPYDMRVTFYIEYKTVNTSYGVRLFKNSTRLKDIWSTDTDWSSYTRAIDLMAGDTISYIVYGGIYYRNISLFVGSQVYPTDPYSSEIFQIDWTSEAGTLYGGYVDLVSGEVIRTQRDYYFDPDNLPSTMRYYNNQFGCAIGFTIPEGKTINGLVKCNCLPIKYDDSDTSTFPYMLVLENSGKCYCFIMRGLLSDYPEINAASANDKPALIKQAVGDYIKQNNLSVQLVYSNRTPVTYQLTPQQLQSLKGVNNIWSTSNDITEVEYDYAESVDILKKKKQIIWSSTPPPVPMQYKQIEYLESTGTQYIDTNYVPTYGDEIYGSFSENRVSGDFNALFSAGTGTYQLIMLTNPQYGNGFYYKYFASGGAKKPAFGGNIGDWYSFKIQNDGKIYKNGTVYLEQSPYENELDGSDNTLRLMLRRNGNSPWYGKLGRFTITNNGITKFDLVPCIRSDSKPGMYDTVSKTFYTNAGTGEFVIPT